MSEHDEELVVQRIGFNLRLHNGLVESVLHQLKHGDPLPGGNEVVSSRFMVLLLQHFRDMAETFVELAEFNALDNVDLDAAREALVLLDVMIAYRRKDSGHGRQNSH